MEPSFSKIKISMWGYFWKILILLFLFMIIIGWGLVLFEYNSEISILKADQLAKIDAQSDLIQSELKSVYSDLSYLSHQNELHQYFKDQDLQWLALVADEYFYFSQEKKIYDQIRFLNHSGMEIVRINFRNGDPLIIANEYLQDKANRYYFLDTFRLDKDQIFISPFDLNIEQGDIEQPIKPMIRFGIPIFDGNGEKQGIVLLNYLGNNLINKLDQINITNLGEIMLVNKDGYWLNSANPENEWGFMYQDKKEIGFAWEFPELWQEINSNLKGQIFNKSGLITFDTIYPILDQAVSSNGAEDAFAKSTSSFSGDEVYWKVISFIPKKELNQIRLEIIREIELIFIPIGFLLLLLTIVISRWQSERRISQNVLRMTAKVFETTSEGIMVLQPDGIIQTVNDAFGNLTGYSSNEIVGKNCSLLWEDPLSKEQKIPFWKPSQGETFLQGEFWCRRKNGSKFLQWLRISEMPNEEGELESYVGVFNDITDRKEAEKRLEYIATHDGLTQLPNRMKFIEHLDRVILRASEYDFEVAVLFIDLDKFKEVNDNYGHDIGDKLLILVGERIKKIVRDHDLVARMGGDEYTVVIENFQNKEIVEIVKERILHSLRLPFSIDNNEILIGASIGISYYPEDGLEVEKLLQRADHEMYKNKNDIYKKRG